MLDLPSEVESSRASPDAPLDALSDYDVMVVATDVAPLRENDAWLRTQGDCGDW